MPNILDIVKNPTPSLREVSKDVKTDDISKPEMKQLIEDMKLTMIKKDGVGLAAPQIGKNIRLIVVNHKDGPICLINPKIIKKSWRKEWDEEGCLSVPNVFGQVQRHKSVLCVFKNEEGKLVQMDAQGFLARILQHEIDHLDGILFIDKAKNIKELS